MAAGLYLIGTAINYLAALIVPIAIALLLTALLAPAVSYLTRHGIPTRLATAAVLVGGLAGLGGLLTFVIMTFINGLPALQAQLAVSIDTVTQWLATGPLQLSPAQLLAVRDNLLTALNANPASLTAGALSTAGAIVATLSQVLLVAFTLIFFLHGGEQIWRFLTHAAPQAVRARVDVAGRHGLAALVSYVRATVVVAVVDAVSIGTGLAILTVPLAVPLAALVFLSAFIPIIGAVIAGAVAVLIALVAKGLIPALVVLGIVTAVMQLESHVLQPVLLGRAVRLHPLAVVLALGTGLLMAGIAGALLAVPLPAALNSAIRSLLSETSSPAR